jgi:dolichol-phosphate mannosyltransferase
MNAVLAIPTYNESENILRIIDAVHGVVPAVHIVVIDDGSPDGTAALVRERMSSDQRLHLIERSGKLGLGTAYCAAFAWALERSYDVVLQMDADFSHDPNDLPRFLTAIEEGNDLVIGSRYIQGVNVINWPMSRLLLSWFANAYTRVITGMPIADATGGFKAIRASVLKLVDLSKIHSNGYAFQIEMNYRLWRAKARIKELPIIFTDRVSGVSKMSKSIVYEAAFLVWKLKLTTIFTFGRR